MIAESQQYLVIGGGELSIQFSLFQCSDLLSFHVSPTPKLNEIFLPRVPGFRCFQGLDQWVLQQLPLPSSHMSSPAARGPSSSMAAMEFSVLCVFQAWSAIAWLESCPPVAPQSRCSLAPLHPTSS